MKASFPVSICLVLILCFSISCKKKSSTETATFRGIVLDYETRTPIQSAIVNYTLFDGISGPGPNLVNPVTGITYPNISGQFLFNYKAADRKKFYIENALLASFKYVYNTGILGKTISYERENVDTLLLSRATYLKLSVKDTVPLGNFATIAVIGRYDSLLGGGIFQPGVLYILNSTRVNISDTAFVLDFIWSLNHQVVVQTSVSDSTGNPVVTNYTLDMNVFDTTNFIVHF